MIQRHTIILLGISQLLCWGLSFYIIGVFGDRIAADMDWGKPVDFGGFSAALTVMGIVSPMAGRAIGRFGGRGALFLATFLASLALATAFGLERLAESLGHTDS